ncbi:hypothetical protein NA57DRAFT_71927 [Rhizodiscina lignyota]|uniref:Homeobox domain-containing protein n=1 Tax=Rhizodiscina lignyota TaxID=1504668 RepID=A0A9P4M9L4_9PEZI|nr:hypothetical protein NA57DRAFT_71927 [Rhizodiscina lignyota]
MSALQLPNAEANSMQTESNDPDGDLGSEPLQNVTGVGAALNADVRENIKIADYPLPSKLPLPLPPAIHIVPNFVRLTREQHDILEAHFQQQAKPSKNTKNGFAESLGVPLDKINNWFQNRRAHVKQDCKKQMDVYNKYQQQLSIAQINNVPAVNEVLGSIQEPHHTAPSEDIMNNLTPSSYPTEAIDLGEIIAEPIYMALNDSHYATLQPNSEQQGLCSTPATKNGLNESMSSMGIQQHSESSIFSFKQPSSLASGRQQPRPAALGQVALRSASYSAGMPASPKSNADLVAQDQSLRRIRRSGVPGVQNSRTQRLVDTPIRCLPANMTFADIASSPGSSLESSLGSSIYTPQNADTSSTATSLAPNDIPQSPPQNEAKSVRTTSRDEDITEHGYKQGFEFSRSDIVYRDELGVVTGAYFLSAEDPDQGNPGHPIMWTNCKPLNVGHSTTSDKCDELVGIMEQELSYMFHEKDEQDQLHDKVDECNTAQIPLSIESEISTESTKSSPEISCITGAADTPVSSYSSGAESPSTVDMMETGSPESSGSSVFSDPDHLTACGILKRCLDTLTTNTITTSHLTQHVYREAVDILGSAIRSTNAIRQCAEGASQRGSSNKEDIASNQQNLDQQLYRGVQKRRYSSVEDGNRDDQNDEERPNKQQRQISELGSPRKLACPYFKHDPCRYGNASACSGPGWPSIHRLKEHLYRRHTRPIACSRCGCQFQSESELFGHQQQTVPCELNQTRVLEGLTKDQERELRSKRTKSNKCTEEKWCRVYRILFPQVPENQIPSPYYDYPHQTPSHTGLLDSAAVRRRVEELFQRVRVQIQDVVQTAVEEFEQQILQDHQIASRTSALSPTQLFNQDNAEPISAILDSTPSESAQDIFQTRPHSIPLGPSTVAPEYSSQNELSITDANSDRPTVAEQGVEASTLVVTEASTTGRTTEDTSEPMQWAQEWAKADFVEFPSANDDVWLQTLAELN